MRNLRTVFAVSSLVFGGAAAWATMPPAMDGLARSTPEDLDSAERVVSTFTGRSSTQTLAFSVDGNWRLEWQVEGNEKFPSLSYFQADLYDARTHAFLGTVAQVTGSGAAQKLVPDGGRFFLKVRARNVDWSVQVVDVQEPWEQLGLVPKDRIEFMFGASDAELNALVRPSTDPDAPRLN